MTRTALVTGALLAGIASAYAQELPTIEAGSLQAISPAPAVQDLQAAARASGMVQPDVVGPPLKVFPYSVTTPRGGGTWTGTIVGADPRANGARTTNIPVVLIPLRVQFTGVTPQRNFDPTSPDVGCLGAGNTALQRTLDSPIFTPIPNLTINGVNMGNVTFIDAFQRAQFWSTASGGPMVSGKPAYHLGLPITMASVQTISVPVGTNAALYNLTGNCNTNTTAQDNPPNFGVININTIDPLLNAIITSLGINQSQFPLFLIYGVVMSNGAANNINNCCIIGYHNGSGNSAAPGQTYGIAEYDAGVAFGTAIRDVTTLAHEVLEWANDPSGNNIVPAWGGLGQVSGCQNNLETGDPADEPSGSNHAIVAPNGFTYHPQENAFFNWFLPGTFLGAGGKFSSKGSFGGFAKACPPGGTN